jgi:hypothetical protein
MIATTARFPAAKAMPGLSLRRVREMLWHHRRQIDEGERAFRQWQAQWWFRERAMEEQLRRIEQQLAFIPRPVPRLSVVCAESRA